MRPRAAIFTDMDVSASVKCDGAQGAENGIVRDPVHDFAHIDLDALPLAMLVVDDHGRIAHANTAASTIFGYSPEEFLALALSDLVPQDIRGIHGSWVQQYFANPERRRMGVARDLKALRSNGSTFYCEIGLNPVIRERRTWVIASVVECHAHDASSADASGGIARWRQVLEQLGEYLWMWDLRNDDVDLSSSWLTVMGYTADEIPSGDAWFALVHADDAEQVAANCKRCLDGETPVFEDEFRIRHRDGSYRWVRSRAQVVETASDGSARRVLGLYRDTTEEHAAKRALEVAERRWKFALEGSAAGVWDWDLVSGAVYFSPQWKHMLGFGADDLEPTIETWRELALPEDLAHSDAAIASYLAGDTDEYCVECRIRTKDGATKWILDRGMVVERAEDGEPSRMIGTHTDITELKRREKELRESREKLEGIAALLPGAVYQYKRSADGRHCFPYASAGIKAIYGLEPGDIETDATEVLSRIHPDDLDDVTAAIDSSARELEKWDQEYRVVVDGEVHWVHGIGNPHPDARDDGAILWHGYISDICSRKKAEQELALAEKRHTEELRYQSLHDELTGLPNRRLFLDRLDQSTWKAEREGGSFAVLAIDLDRFKPINDSLGHEAGDNVLRAIGDRTLEIARRSDTYARMGGDEFAVLLPSTKSVDGALTVAQRINEVISRPIRLDQGIVEVGASIGVAIYPDHGTTSKTLLAHADEAMYVAKRSAGHFAVYSDDSAEPLNDAARISLEISRVVEAEHLDLAYQLNWDLASGRAVGAQALARWNHPDLGAVSPTDFVPLVERSRFLNEFTDMVFDKALGHAAAWRRQGLDLPVSVNVSTRALESDGFAERALDWLGHYGLDPNNLTIEVNETTSLGDYDISSGVLKRLAEQGVGISIGDFGSVFTSLRYLRDFAASEIRIDRLFVAKVADHGRDQSIISGIIQLAHSIGARTVADGVESEQILRVLAELGCEYGQGNYLSRPLSAADVVTAASAASCTPAPRP